MEKYFGRKKNYSKGREENSLREFSKFPKGIF